MKRGWVFVRVARTATGVPPTTRLAPRHQPWVRSLHLTSAPRSITTSPRPYQKKEQTRAKDNDVAPSTAPDPAAHNPLTPDDITPPHAQTSATIDDFLSSLPQDLPEDLLAELRQDLENTQANTASLEADIDTSLLGDGFLQDPDIESIVNEPEIQLKEPKPKPGFFAEGEGAEDVDEDPDFEPNDIATPAHFELEQERELREFARVIVWDMPLLYSHRKVFEAPAASEKPLRWRYTTYVGEHHPAAKKVVLTFRPEDLLGLNTAQIEKLKRLVGPRWNPDKRIVTMGAEYHPTPAQNKRHLCEQLNTLLKEVKEGKDTFEDIPLDIRHWKKKRMPKFPEEWKLTDSRVAQLADARAKKANDEGSEMIDGRAIIGKMLAAGTRAAEQPVLVGAGRSSAKQRQRL